MILQQPQIDNLVMGYTMTVTTGSTTVLTIYSNNMQRFTGTLNQTVQLPVVSGLTINQGWEIVNDSTGIVTINSSGGNLVTYCTPNINVELNCISLSGTDASSWMYSVKDYKQSSIYSVTVTGNTTISNILNNTIISNGTSLTHILPTPSSYLNTQWSITNINSTPCTLTGTINGDINPLLYQYETFTFYSNGSNLYLK